MPDSLGGPGSLPASQQDDHLDADSPAQEEQRKASSQWRSKVGCKILLVRVGYWACTSLGVLGALVLLVTAGRINAEHQAALEEQAQDGFDAQERITAAEEGLEDLPKSEEIQRWLLQATTVGEDVAAVQNIYLEHTGSIQTDDLPSQAPPLGESEECAPYLDDRSTGQREYTEEELITCAEGLRESAVEGLERQLTPHFAEHVRDSDGFNPVGGWHLWISTLDKDASLAEYTWVAHQAHVFEQDTAIRMVWTLTEEEGGQTVAWLRGQYDPVIKKFDDLVLGTIADSEGNSEEYAGTEQEDESTGGEW